MACNRSAVAGLTMMALSHVSLVIGLGSSCSQPLLANRPSRTDGSFRNAISRAAAGCNRAARKTEQPRALTGFCGKAVFGITPS
jgi:hypothetical protein